MKTFRLTLTRNKSYRYYLKKIILLTLLLTVFLFGVFIYQRGFRIINLFWSVLVSFLFVDIWYGIKVYYIEPFFMIQDEGITYRLFQLKRKVKIKSSTISLIIITDSSIEILDYNNNLKKIKLGFVPDEYVLSIKKQMFIFAEELKIKFEYK
jgi:hypothetical protein